MRKTIAGNKTVTKTPPKKASKSGSEDVWSSPRNHKKSRELDVIDVGGSKRGSGAVNWGVKMHSFTSPSSAEPSLDKESESDDNDKSQENLTMRVNMAIILFK